ncbi:cytochrome D1, partial [Pseudomonas prosekii]
MNRTIKLAGCALVVGVALVWLGVWRTTPATLLSEVAVPDAWSNQTLQRDGVAVQFKVQALAEDGVLREGAFADVQFRVTDSNSGQPLAGVNPGAWVDPETVAADQAQGREQSCKSRVGVFLKSSIGARPLLDLNSYYLLVMNRDASVSVVDPSVSVGGITSTMARIELKQPPM